jgi:SNF2 family DNA or RNA helicase|uniref:Chromatin remodeling complex ATPase n=1 Tax=Phage sp. ctqZP6 TaxID=2828010 RepID=A0A8S5SHY8_9VIRU|nr:MAG TPA: Chromatin remodeling complex ATPase [Phage sp. ctqZP6]
MSIYDKLYPFQKNVVDKFRSYKKFGLFLDMGLGKTPTSLALAEVNNCSKVLIVTINGKALEPVTEPGSWLNWASRSTFKFDFLNKFSEPDAFALTKSLPQLFIINYEGLFKHGKRSTRSSGIVLNENITEFLKACRRENVCVIIDESHKVKNLQSQQTKAINQIVNTLERTTNSVHLYLCTGTPFTKGYIDLYSQLKLLGYPETKGDFVERFCIRGRVPGLLEWQQPIVGYKNVDALFNLVHHYAITIRSEDVMDLPDKFFVNISQPVSPAFEMFTREKRKGKDILDFAKSLKIKLSEFDQKRYNTESLCSNPFFRNIDYPSLDFFAETSGTAWMRARQLSTGFIGNASKAIWYDRSRLDALEKFLSENEDNYLLFYNYTPELCEIFEICEKLDYNIDVYCGEIKSLMFYERYAKMSDAEKLTNKKNIIIANFASGSTGLNWQEYNKCILFSTPVYKDYAQGHKRVHRLGQKADKVLYYCFFQRNWLDMNMRKALDGTIEYNEDMFQADLARVNELKGE